jgi:hypothetical protein
VEKEGTSEDYFIARTAYWAAFYGFESLVKFYIEDLKFSPYIRTYKNRNVLMGAILGS